MIARLPWCSLPPTTMNGGRGEREPRTRATTASAPGPRFPGALVPCRGGGAESSPRGSYGPRHAVIIRAGVERANDREAVRAFGDLGEQFGEAHGGSARCDRR